MTISLVCDRCHRRHDAAHAADPCPFAAQLEAWRPAPDTEHDQEVKDE